AVIASRNPVPCDFASSTNSSAVFFSAPAADATSNRKTIAHLHIGQLLYRASCLPRFRRFPRQHNIFVVVKRISRLHHHPVKFKADREGATSCPTIALENIRPRSTTALCASPTTSLPPWLRRLRLITCWTT